MLPLDLTTHVEFFPLLKRCIPVGWQTAIKLILPVRTSLCVIHLFTKYRVLVRFIALEYIIIPL